MDEPRGAPARASGRLLAAVDRGVAAVEDALNLLAGLAVFALMLFVAVEVVGRRLFNAPIPGHIDMVELGMVTFAVLGAAYCQRLGGHVRMELVVSRAPRPGDVGGGGVRHPGRPAGGRRPRPELVGPFLARVDDRRHDDGHPAPDLAVQAPGTAGTGSTPAG